LKGDEGGLAGHYPLGHLAAPLKDAVEGAEGGLGGVITPLGHLRRGINLSVTGNGGTLPKVIPEGRPPTPSFTGVILALRVTGTSHSPLSAG
jgi:hypothetical protein